MAAGSIAGQRLSSTVARVQHELGELEKEESALAAKRKALSAELSRQVLRLEEVTKKQKTAAAAGGSCSSAPAAAVAAPYWSTWTLDTFIQGSSETGAGWGARP